VLDFFATWCSPCVAELPELERLRADLQTNYDIEFVLVGTNKGGDTAERVRAFVQRRHISIPRAFDPEQKRCTHLVRSRESSQTLQQLRVRSRRKLVSELL
jgi:thiol-disulfide isomerase/thioredoxin